MAHPTTKVKGLGGSGYRPPTGRASAAEELVERGEGIGLTLGEAAGSGLTSGLTVLGGFDASVASFHKVEVIDP